METLKPLYLGAYVPLRINGKIMVDRVLTSCFADVHHDLAHITTTPMQRFSELMEWIFGNEAGLSVYVSTARQLGELLVPDSQYWNN